METMLLLGKEDKEDKEEMEGDEREEENKHGSDRRRGERLRLL